MTVNRPELTARSRQSLSAPGEELLKRGLLAGRILDFGCGKGDLAKFLYGDVHEWDPHFAPETPQGKFDVVCCIYVLNVLRPQRRRHVVADAKSYVRPGGRLYLAVRRDKFKSGPTRLGTEQYQVHLDMRSLMHRKGAFEIYVWENAKP